uniref:B-cell antigen receptor complex-associated protein alpha chain isoform X2 n=1 Tax=Doryrhamphus excisus TaxID=161450 RepID=UPI0025AEAF98|nr:B-cell antigen receptor complex-associated protein alpha chain isoform X2 [Doryrhamphus excisus]
MATIHIFIICSMAAFASGEVTLEVDRPWLRVQLFHTAFLDCCYRTDKPSIQATWHRHDSTRGPHQVNVSDTVMARDRTHSGITCGTLTLTSVQLNDSGLYRCWLNGTGIFTHGTYLQVYEPLDKTINLSEKAKNDILIAEGMLLFLCIIVPSVTLLLKSKKLHVLQKTMTKREVENIYQGLNLEDCCAMYDQIDRSKVGAGPYQDVLNNVDEEVQLENP